MRVKEFTVSLGDLNLGIEKELDVSIEIEGVRYRPSFVKYENPTGCIIGIMNLANDEEKEDRNSYIGDVDLEYDFLPIEEDASSSKLPKTQYIIVKQLSGIASADLKIYCAGYFSTSY